MSEQENQNTGTTQVVEKRLSRGVIRRRRKEPAAEPKAVEAKKEEKTVGKPTAVKAESPKMAVVTPAKEKAVAKKVEVAKTPVKEQAVTSEKSVAKKTIAPVEKKVEAAVQKTAATRVGEEIVKNLDDKKKKEEKPKRPLTFQERLKGQISLDKLKATTSTTTKKPVKKAAVFEVEESEEEAKKGAVKKEKAVKAKKAGGVKNIGGDLDIEGGGKSTTLTHLVRTTTMDRVFRPDAIQRKKRILSKKKLKSTPITVKKASKRIIEMQGSISVRDFAQQLGVKASEIIKKLMDLGVMATINQPIDYDTAVILAQEYQYEVKDKSFDESAILTDETVTQEEAEANLEARPPVVTVMGHVDHGKTSLLDAIRSTSITDKEAGGITQHIGAYTVSLDEGKVTFLDTPGHEAFTAMRARGAKVTDIVILVVAADDGLMPQTEESISHAQAAGVPIIVAVNKMDKPEADPDRVMRQLSEKGLLAEEWGGDVLFVKVSAKTKEGIKELLESILLQSEMLELQANSEKRAAGIVLEAQLDRSRGPVCTLLVQEGTLKVGDSVVVGVVAGKVRAMLDWKGQQIKEAGPSTAVEILGLEGVPEASDLFNVVANDQDAKKVAEHRAEEKRQKELTTNGKVSLEDMFSKMQEGEVKELNIILKTDVQGSLEAVRDAVTKLATEEVKTKIIHSGVGGIKEADVQLAMASGAVIIGFNVRPETKAIHLAKEKGVDIKLYKIIYDLVNEVKLAMEGMLAPTIKENYLGRAEVRDTFQVSKFGLIAGCMVVDGLIKRNANLRLLRDNVVIHEGKIGSLKRFKEDAKEVKQGFECGVGIEGYQDVKVGDVIEAYELEEVQRTL